MQEDLLNNGWCHAFRPSPLYSGQPIALTFRFICLTVSTSDTAEGTRECRKECFVSLVYLP